MKAGNAKYRSVLIERTDGSETSYTDMPAEGVILGAARITLKTPHWITIIPWASIRAITLKLR